MTETFKIKRAEFYSNKFPLEDLLPELSHEFIRDFVKYSEYTLENDKLARHEDMPLLNQEDAYQFYKMGYEAAKNRIGSVLEPYTRIL